MNWVDYLPDVGADVGTDLFRLDGEHMNRTYNTLPTDVGDSAEPSLLDVHWQTPMAELVKSVQLRLRRISSAVSAAEESSGMNLPTVRRRLADAKRAAEDLGVQVGQIDLLLASTPGKVR